MEQLECRSFWKAGNYEPPPPSSVSSRSPQDLLLETGDFDRARVHPKFLHTNATSHKWAFGAIAELFDNVVDEICNGATFVKVDKVLNMKDNSPMLLIQDDGGGMDPKGLRQCMSLGFSTKRSKSTIGQYGNGFKTSTMRLGADAVVFTRANNGGNATMSIGLLSYTFLRKTMKDDIVVPLLDFQIQDEQIKPILYSSRGDWDSNLDTLLGWSPFSSLEKLLTQFNDIGSHGTKVFIYNLWMNDDGLFELDFEDNDEDILLRDRPKVGRLSGGLKVEDHVSYKLKYSLRAYASVLYLRKFSNFRIIIRGRAVQQIDIVDEMKFKKTTTYKPQVGRDTGAAPVQMTIGFAKEAPVLGIFGINVYHKNRLIMPFWKVLQEGSSRGRSVLGILEANFIEPAHDKQDFERTPLFIRLETKLRQIILDYWKENRHFIGYQMDADRKNKSNRSSGAFSDACQRMQALKNDIVLPLRVNRHDGSPEHMGSVSLHENLSQFSGSIGNPLDLEEEFDDPGALDLLDPDIVKKMTEESRILLARREELRSKDDQLKKTIGDLERELEETKQKCSNLATLLLRGRNQTIG